jgi:hypothetical protein
LLIGAAFRRPGRHELADRRTPAFDSLINCAEGDAAPSDIPTGEQYARVRARHGVLLGRNDYIISSKF